MSSTLPSLHYTQSAAVRTSWLKDPLSLPPDTLPLVALIIHLSHWWNQTPWFHFHLGIMTLVRALGCPKSGLPEMSNPSSCIIFLLSQLRSFEETTFPGLRWGEDHSPTGETVRLGLCLIFTWSCMYVMAFLVQIFICPNNSRPLEFPLLTWISPFSLKSVSLLSNCFVRLAYHHSCHFCSLCLPYMYCTLKYLESWKHGKSPEETLSFLPSWRTQSSQKLSMTWSASDLMLKSRSKSRSTIFHYQYLE